MNRFLVTTTRRHCGPDEASGFLFTLDLPGRRVTGQCPVIEPPHRAADPNPRGGMRGAKGVAVVGEELLVANASVVHRFNAAWELTGAVSHPSCASLHDITEQAGDVWVASCANDLLCRLAPDGRLRDYFSPRGQAAVRQALDWPLPPPPEPAAVRAGTLDFRDPRTHRAEDHDCTHLNSFCRLPGGDLLVLLGLVRPRHWAAQLALKNFLKRLRLWGTVAATARRLLRALPLARVPRGDVGTSLASASALVLRLDPQGGVRVVLHLTQRRVPTHSLVAVADGTALLADTTAGAVVHFDPDGGTELSRLKVTDGFLRGLCPLGDGRLLAGSHNEVLLIDLHRRVVLDRVRLTADLHVAVFAIQPLPLSFRPLPARLTGHPRCAAAARG